MRIDYKELSFNELLQIIKECQEEIDKRGTISTFKIEDYRKVKKTTYPEYSYFEGKDKDGKQHL